MARTSALTWNEFRSKHKDLGISIQQMSKMYHEQKPQSKTHACVRKGSRCSQSGLAYEKKIGNDSSLRKILGEKYQSCSSPAGSTSDHDLVILYDNKRVPIEIKRPSPDWMQVKLTYDSIRGTWSVTDSKTRNPEGCKRVFNEAIGTQSLWENRLPSFISTGIMPFANEWKNEKTVFRDTYIPGPPETISKLYEEKGCKYIQIAEKGLFKLTPDDPFNLGVPLFHCEQQIRIRVKIHSSKRKSDGRMSLSVTAAAQPKHFSQIIPSSSTLDPQ